MLLERPLPRVNEKLARDATEFYEQRSSLFDHLRSCFFPLNEFFNFILFFFFLTMHVDC